MQVVNKKMCVIVILVLVIIESCTLFLMYKSFSNKNTNLDEVNLNINNSNMFAIMLEQDDGTYKEDTSNTWPTEGYSYNASMSGCIDLNGNKLDGVLTYDATNNIATVDTGNTSYCYLYFNVKLNAGKYLLKNPTNGLVTTSLQGGLYRYQGVQGEVDNYICFGTTDKNECTNDTNAYMYRIIGITQDNKLKLIKKETLENTSLGCTSVWYYSEPQYDYSWNENKIYKSLNGFIEAGVDIFDPTVANSFIDGTLYPYMSANSSWYNKIESVDWKYGKTGDIMDAWNYNGNSVYEVENGFTNRVNAKIGLMYIHDYYYAYPEGNPGNEENAKSSWIFLSNNDTEHPDSECYWLNPSQYVNEALLTDAWYEESWSGNYLYSWIIRVSNSINPNAKLGVVFQYSEEVVIRPVFYLKSDEKITSGTGTIDDPYIIS